MKIPKKLIIYIASICVCLLTLNTAVVFLSRNIGNNSQGLLLTLIISNLLFIILIFLILLSFYFIYGINFIKIIDEISSFKIDAKTIPLINIHKNDDFRNLKISFDNLLDRINTDRIKLSRNEKTFRTVFEKAPMGIALSNANECKMIRLNSCFKEILKLNPLIDEPVDWESLTHPDDLEEDKKNMKLLASGEIESFKMIKRYVLKDASIVWVSMSVARINGNNPDIPMAICMVNDITGYKQKENEIFNLTFNDPLTGLKNRNFYENMVKEYNSNKKVPVSVIVGDINGLKMMNDGFGHHYGDGLLKKAAVILEESLRDSDFICRIGGDEFCIFLPDTFVIQAESLCNKINHACKIYSEKRGREIFHLSISLGCATKLLQDEDINETIRAAEDNMQRNKLKNRKENRLLFLDSMTNSLLDKKLDSLERMNRLSSMASSAKNIFKLNDEEVYSLTLLSNFHNIGKISILADIFFKKDTLSPIEIREIRKHPDIGYRIAMAISEFISIADLVLTHHERYDGKGYPQGISETSIPKLSRIFSLFDSYDAMVNDRPYRNAMPKNEALAEILKNSGTQFDPNFAETFVSWISGDK